MHNKVLVLNLQAVEQVDPVEVVVYAQEELLPEDLEF
jgi:hypothetical protein